jgi:hypothetical protein
MLALGNTRGTVRSNRTRTIGDKLAVSLRVDTASGDDCEVTIFITEKSANIARRQLKIAGFDVDARELSELDEHPGLLAGRAVPLKVEEYRGKMQVQIAIDGGAGSADDLRSATALLRSAKKSEGPTAYDEPPPLGDDEIPF